MVHGDDANRKTFLLGRRSPRLLCVVEGVRAAGTRLPGLPASAVEGGEF